MNRRIVGRDQNSPERKPPPEAVSVSELNEHLKAVVEQTFPPIWVFGEVSDVAKPRSGHVYFTLKDDESQIRAVLWRGNAYAVPFEIQNGQALLCFGNLEVYAVRGTYQLVVRKARPQGQGTLQQALEKLKHKLGAEGLFDAERKQSLPRHPRRIAIVTSPSGAAVHDFLVAAENRMSLGEIFVIPAQVQGDGAAETIARGIRAAAMIRPTLDCVVVARGGGSLEDLWCFNEEKVVRAIAECSIPVVSAIGHEVDVTLSDFAADVRALTPTDAASKVFPDQDATIDRVADLMRRLQRSMRYEVERRRGLLESLRERPVLAKPLEMIRLRSRSLDDLDLRAKLAITRRLEKAQTDVATAAGKLAALSPLETLARGYSVTRNRDGEAITSTDQITEGQEIETILHDGRLRSTVIWPLPEDPLG
ncbi:MAG: exodeoxyribonuclease VII large subunit [Planctomycetota bacterium]